MIQDFKKIPISKVTSPPEKSGTYECIVNNWWCVTEDDCILLYGKYGARQCNLNKAVIDHMLTLDLYPATKAVQLLIVFMPHECGDYR